MENVTMMINNAGYVFKLKKKTKLHNLPKIKA